MIPLEFMQGALHECNRRVPNIYLILTGPWTDWITGLAYIGWPFSEYNVEGSRNEVLRS